MVIKEASNFQSEFVLILFKIEWFFNLNWSWNRIGGSSIHSPSKNSDQKLAKLLVDIKNIYIYLGTEYAFCSLIWSTPNSRQFNAK